MKPIGIVAILLFGLIQPTGNVWSGDALTPPEQFTADVLAPAMENGLESSQIRGLNRQYKDVEAASPTEHWAGVSLIIYAMDDFLDIYEPAKRSKSLARIDEIRTALGGVLTSVGIKDDPAAEKVGDRKKRTALVAAYMSHLGSMAATMPEARQGVADRLNSLAASENISDINKTEIAEIAELVNTGNMIDANLRFEKMFQGARMRSGNEDYAAAQVIRRALQPPPRQNIAFTEGYQRFKDGAMIHADIPLPRSSRHAEIHRDAVEQEKSGKKVTLYGVGALAAAAVLVKTGALATFLIVGAPVILVAAGGAALLFGGIWWYGQRQKRLAIEAANPDKDRGWF